MGTIGPNCANAAVAFAKHGSEGGSNRTPSWNAAIEKNGVSESKCHETVAAPPSTESELSIVDSLDCGVNLEARVKFDARAETAQRRHQSCRACRQLAQLRKRSCFDCVPARGLVDAFGLTSL